MITGLVLLLAAALDVYNNKQGRFSVFGSIMRPFRRDDGSPPDTTSPPSREADTADKADKATATG
jgi:putative multiple sugar transport system permease protein